MNELNQYKTIQFNTMQISTIQNNALQYYNYNTNCSSQTKPQT